MYRFVTEDSIKMVYPAAIAISLGLGIGAALFLLYTLSSRASPYSEPFEEERPNRGQNHWRDPYSAMRDQVEKYEQSSAFNNYHFNVSCFNIFFLIFSDNCSVCLESLAGSTLNLECRHRFHRECIERSLQHSPLCPMCRAYVKIRR